MTTKDCVFYTFNDDNSEVIISVPLNEGESIELPHLEKLMIYVVGLTHCDIKPDDIRKAVDAAIKSFKL